MQKKSKLKEKNFVLFLVLLLSVCGLMACNNKSDEKGNSKAKNTSTANLIPSNDQHILVSRDNCIILTRANVESWLSKGWDDPTESSYIPSIVFAVTNNPDPVSIIAYPRDKNQNSQISKAIDTRVKGGLNPPCSLPPYDIQPEIIYENFPTNFSDQAGNLIGFTFLRLRPRLYSNPEQMEAYSNLLTFEIEAVTNVSGGELVTYKGECKPSPPARYSLNVDSVKIKLKEKRNK